MIIQEIIAIAGKPGLFRIVVTNRNNLMNKVRSGKIKLKVPDVITQYRGGSMDMAALGDALGPA